MKRRLVVLMFVFAILFVGSFLAVDSWGSVVSRAPEEVREAFKSVVEVHVTVIWRGELEKEEGGSGFFVAPSYLLTAPHVVSQFHQVIEDPRTKIEVIVGRKIYLAQVVAIDWTKELMLLKVEGASQVPVVKLADNIEKDKTVFITGYIFKFLKNKREPFIALAIVESIDDKKTAKKFSLARMVMDQYGVSKLLTIFGRSGEEVSGGPVFNMEGEVVGLSWVMADDYVFATPVDVIREFLEEHLEGLKDEQ